MAKIKQLNLFSWKILQDEAYSLGDLERLKLVLDTMPDEGLINKLYSIRKNGRNDYPIEATWNSILAGIVFQHPSIESLSRELKRNGQLREFCGFDPLLGLKAIPTSSAYSRFLANLMSLEPLVKEMFDYLVRELTDALPDFGKNLAGDGKPIKSFGKPCKKENNDRRKEEDADWGKKTYKGIDKDGKLWEKTKSWFGFRLHLLADADFEQPVAYEVTKASVGEGPVMRELLEGLSTAHPDLIERCEHGLFDKGYDATETICSLWDKYKIKPIIDIRNMWKDGDKTRLLKSKEVTNVTYDYKGTVYCHCPESGEIRTMSYGGFEKKRKTQKYICPVRAYGIECKGAQKCPLYKKSLRIPMSEDRRIFTPVARASYKWEKLYKKRTSIERVNSRIEVGYGLEKHYVRGLKKMKLRCGLSLCVMQAIAVGRLRKKEEELMRSLTKTAA